MKKTILILAFTLVQSLTFAQAPAIQWQKNLGGTCNDIANNIQKTSDGGYIVAGYSCSNDSDVTGNHGDNDFWITKLSASGTIQWQKSLGGSGRDEANSIQQTADGGYIVVGQTNSNDGDVTGLHANGVDPVYWQFDYWVVKLGATGTLEWQKTLGGILEDVATSVVQTPDGGYVVAGYTHSNDGDLNIPNQEINASWIVKLNSSGLLEWQQLLSYYVNNPPASPFWYRTRAFSIQQTAEGGFIVGGLAWVYNGNEGFFQCFIAKLSSTGITEWYQVYSNINDRDSAALSIQQTIDGGYIVAGHNEGFDLNNNIWIIKLNSVGTIEWQKHFGGSLTDYSYSIKQTLDGGYIMAGTTASTDGDITSNQGGTDALVVKLSATGTQEWQKTLGGSTEDFAQSIVETSSGEYILTGFSNSNDGDLLTGNMGNYDLWVVKLGASLSTNGFEKNSMMVYPNPTKNRLNLQFPNQVKADKIVISDLTGKVILEQTGFTNQVDVSQFANGMYIIKAFSGKEEYQTKFIKD